MQTERAFSPDTGYQIPDTKKAHIAYNWKFDLQDRRQLETSRSFLEAEEFQRRKDQLDARITENLKSEIRERFCTLEYQTSYSLENGRLVNVHHDEPFAQIIKRGIDYRQKNGSNDLDREQAELVGFERIEQIFSQMLKLTPQSETLTPVILGSPSTSLRVNSATPESKLGKDSGYTVPCARSIDGAKARMTRSFGFQPQVFDSEGRALRAQTRRDDRSQMVPKTVVSISPKGDKQSVYRHNFFDVFQKQEDGKIQMTRFTSTASYEDFQKAVQKLNPVIPQPVTPSDAYFLAHPIETNLSLEEILQTIEIDKNALAKEYVEHIIEACVPVIMAYVANPSEKGYKAAVNLADILAGKKAINNQQSTINNYSPATSYQSPATINYLASLPVRQVTTGCGISGSNSIQAEASRTLLNPWSVADFGLNTSEEDKSDFPCPKCGHIIIYGSGTKRCPACGLEATCA